MDPSRFHPPWPSIQAEVATESNPLAPTCRIIAHRYRGVGATMSWDRENQPLVVDQTIQIRHLRARHPIQTNTRLVNWNLDICIVLWLNTRTESLPLSSSSLMETSLSLSLRLLRFAILTYLYRASMLWFAMLIVYKKCQKTNAAKNF